MLSGTYKFMVRVNSLNSSMKRSHEFLAMVYIALVNKNGDPQCGIITLHHTSKLHKCFVTEKSCDRKVAKNHVEFVTQKKKNGVTGKS